MEPGSMTPLGPHVMKAVSTLLALGLAVHTLDFLLCLLGLSASRYGEDSASELPAARQPAACSEGMTIRSAYGRKMWHDSDASFSPCLEKDDTAYEVKLWSIAGKRCASTLTSLLSVHENRSKNGEVFFKARNGNTQTGEGIVCLEGTFKSCELWQPSSGTEY